MKTSTKVLKINNQNDFLDVITNGARFRIYLLDENIIRIKGTFADDFAPEQSYALVKTAWADATDELLGDERQRVTPISITVTELADHYCVTNGKYVLNIFKEPFYFEIVDENGRVVHQDLPNRAFVEDDFGREYHYSRMGDTNKFYGFGEKSGKLNKFKRRMRMHNTD